MFFHYIVKIQKLNKKNIENKTLKMFYLVSKIETLFMFFQLLLYLKNKLFGCFYTCYFSLNHIFLNLLSKDAYDEL